MDVHGQNQASERRKRRRARAEERELHLLEGHGGFRGEEDAALVGVEGGHGQLLEGKALVRPNDRSPMAATPVPFNKQVGRRKATPDTK